MFGKAFNLFRLLGIQVRIDLSWFLIAALVAWSLRAGLFPAQAPGLGGGTYWAMGVAGALGLFASVVFHEFGHALVARGYGIPIRGITLFIFGGVAELGDEPPSPKAEFFVAIAGPIASVILSGGLFACYAAGAAAGMPLPAAAVLAYLAGINLLLAVFNMVPAFPLDGGRVLRAALWAWKKNLRWATRVAGTLGSGFGILLIALGIMAAFTGNPIGGIWWIVLGMFIRGASQMAYQQVVLRRALEGEPVSKFMHPDPVSVPPDVNIEELVHDYVYRHHHKFFPVVEDGDLIGCISLAQVKELPKEQWSRTRVRDIIRPCSTANTVPPELDAVKALSLMRDGEVSRLLVVRDRELIGIVTLRDLLSFLALKIELEDSAR